MKVLFLDDNQKRIETFGRNIFSINQEDNLRMAGLEVDYAQHATNCKALLEGHKYDLIFLDHDLDERVYVSPMEENTGSEIARFMATNPNPNWMGAVIVIHTLNEFGAQYMRNYLPTSVYLPGVWDQTHHLKNLIDVASKERTALVLETPGTG